MSKTSLGQRNNIIKRQQSSAYKQANSSFRPAPIERFVQPNLNLPQQIQTFLFMKDKLARLQREHQYYTCEPGDTFKSIKDNYGIYIFANGDRYMGEWKEGSMDGMGMYIFSDVGEFRGLVYLGDFLGGLFHGIGKLAYFQDNLGKMVYYGSWAEGKKTNLGVHFYEHPHTYYIGQWNNDLRHGEGKLIFPEGQFKGMWSAGERNGLGSLIKRKKGGSTMWEGNWLHEELPMGIIVYYDDKNVEVGRYEGEIRDGKKHGVGVYKWKGAAYQGQFFEDYIRGRGKFIIGRIQLKGEEFNLHYDLLAGPEIAGQVIFDNGDKFDGYLAIRDGRVILIRGKYDFNYPKDRAEGEFIDTGSDKLRGSFTYFWANGQQERFNT